MPESTKVPEILQEFMKPIVENPLETYRPLYEGISEEFLASIEQAKAFVPLITEEYNKQSGVFPPEFEFFALYNSGTFSVRGVSEEELVAANFPTNKKIYLHMKVKGRGENANSVNVGSVIRAFFKNKAGAVLHIVDMVRNN